jgi:hypothetical protein
VTKNKKEPLSRPRGRPRLSDRDKVSPYRLQVRFNSHGKDRLLSVKKQLGLVQDADVVRKGVEVISSILEETEGKDYFVLLRPDGQKVKIKI